MSYKKLICITGHANNNKFYEMRRDGDHFNVTYGRVGAINPQTGSYPIYLWDKKYHEKLKKGYKDVTDLATVTGPDATFADIDHPQINQLMNTLMQYSKKRMELNYDIEARDVTQAMINEAQRILSRIAGRITNPDVRELNEKLIELYTTIPRRMKNVRDHLLPTTISSNELEKLIRKKIEEEQDTLDTMSSQVSIAQKQAAGADEKHTLLDVLNIKIDTITPDEETVIRQLIGSEHAGLYHRAFKVTNINSQNRYDQYVAAAEHKREELFWHGSRNENWLSILETSLLLRPANAIRTGAMFGHGIYFADRFRKSLNYSSLLGSYWSGGTSAQAFLALFKVHLGKPYVADRHKSEYYDLDWDRLRGYGNYDSLHARGGVDLRNDEFIVYKEDQTTIGYLVEIKR